MTVKATILSDRFLNKNYPHTYESSACMACARHIAQDQLDALRDALEGEALRYSRGFMFPYDEWRAFWGKK